MYSVFVLLKYKHEHVYVLTLIKYKLINKIYYSIIINLW